MASVTPISNSGAAAPMPPALVTFRLSQISDAMKSVSREIQLGTEMPALTDAGILVGVTPEELRALPPEMVGAFLKTLNEALARSVQKGMIENTIVGDLLDRFSQRTGQGSLQKFEALAAIRRATMSIQDSDSPWNGNMTDKAKAALFAVNPFTLKANLAQLDPRDRGDVIAALKVAIGDARNVLVTAGHNTALQSLLSAQEAFLGVLTGAPIKKPQLYSDHCVIRAGGMLSGDSGGDDDEIRRYEDRITGAVYEFSAGQMRDADNADRFTLLNVDHTKSARNNLGQVFVDAGRMLLPDRTLLNAVSFAVKASRWASVEKTFCKLEKVFNFGGWPGKIVGTFIAGVVTALLSLPVWVVAAALGAVFGAVLDVVEIPVGIVAMSKDFYQFINQTAQVPGCAPRVPCRDDEKSAKSPEKKRLAFSAQPMPPKPRTMLARA